MTTTPTPIHVAGTFSRYAAKASPTIRMMKPIRYVANVDIDAASLVSLSLLAEVGPQNEAPDVSREDRL
jgi:hypothetical protein